MGSGTDVGFRIRRAGREVRLPSPHGDARFDLEGYDSHLDAHLGTGKDVMTSCEEDTCRTCEVRGVVGVPDPRGSAHADSEPGRNPPAGMQYVSDTTGRHWSSNA
ncbi:2Fe-2S iron-sulfur cluster binding domain-containing protein [Streptomyces sp. NPDC058171]